MIPTRNDHARALDACWAFTGRHPEFKGLPVWEHDEKIPQPHCGAYHLLNTVAGAWACNEPSMCSHVSRDSFEAAIIDIGSTVTEMKDRTMATKQIIIDDGQTMWLADRATLEAAMTVAEWTRAGPYWIEPEITANLADDPFAAPYTALCQNVEAEAVEIDSDDYPDASYLTHDPAAGDGHWRLTEMEG